MSNSPNSWQGEFVDTHDWFKNWPVPHFKPFQTVRIANDPTVNVAWRISGCYINYAGWWRPRENTEGICYEWNVTGRDAVLGMRQTLFRIDSSRLELTEPPDEDQDQNAASNLDEDAMSNISYTSTDPGSLNHWPRHTFNRGEAVVYTGWRECKVEGCRIKHAWEEEHDWTYLITWLNENGEYEGSLWVKPHQIQPAPSSPQSTSFKLFL